MSQIASGERLPSDELKKILLKADVYAFGLLVGEILTGYIETYLYLGEKKKKKLGMNVRVERVDEG